MTKGITVKRDFHVQRGRSNPRILLAGAKPTSVCVPRISRLMALAIRFDQLIRDGRVKDQAELAKLGRVSRARVTQIMNLLGLPPQIQEELLHQRISNGGTKPITERQLRSVVAIEDWQTQIRLWRSFRAS